MEKTNFFNTCKHSEEDDQTCPFAMASNEKTLCSQILGWRKEMVDVEDIKKCFMFSSPRDKNSILNKLEK